MSGDSFYSMGKWRNRLYYTIIIVSVIISITEYVFYLIKDDVFKAQYGGDLIYLFRFFAIPTVIFMALILFTKIIIGSSALKEETKNLAVTMSFLGVCVVTECIHVYYTPLLCAPCVAIFVSTLFADRRLTLITTFVSYLSLIIATIAGLSEKSALSFFDYISDSAVAGVITLCAYLTSRILILKAKEQLDSLMRDYTKQEALLNELKIEPLTGLYNRRFLDEYLQGAYQHSVAGDEKLSVAMLDIDDFKQVNDTKGHAAGDQVLIALSTIVKENLPGPSKAFRYGGEEISVIFADGKISSSFSCLERIRSSFENDMKEMFPDLKITVSAGLCQMNAEIKSAQIWLSNADKALYKAKKSGKNKTIIFEREKFKNL